jgi:transketolase
MILFSSARNVSHATVTAGRRPALAWMVWPAVAGRAIPARGNPVAEQPANSDQQKLDQLSVNTIRTLAMDAVEKAKSGHPGMPMGTAAMAYVLWTRFLRHNPANPKWADRDRFVLSAGHGSMLLYALLHLTGYDLPLEELKNFRQWGSRTPGHPEHGLVPGVEATTGPLGQGFTYAICSDGDLMEGVASEAASLAGHLGLGKLVYLYDDNHITIDGDTSLSFSEDVGRRFEAYGWHVQHVDGNDLEAVNRAISMARAETGKPSLICARTHIGFGSPNKQDKSSAHGSPLGAEEIKATKAALGWPAEPAFLIPDEALQNFRQAVARGASQEKTWQERFASYAAAHPDLARQWEQWQKGELPAGWREALPKFSAADGAMATRVSSGRTINAVAGVLPNLVGGSADLAASNDTNIKGAASFSPGAAGRVLHFGVREHGMGGVLNGLALHGGLRPFGATFLVFSDYMRPSIRVAALTELPVIYVFTHDSIAVGEDGPTHQPIEHLAALRAMPNVLVIRPADATETAAAWRVALEHHHGPVALALTRQNLPTIDREKFPSADLLEKGGYTLADAQTSPLKLILIATGSEVALALEARTRLEAQGIGTRVVSMPCMELFTQQPPSYREEVLPQAVKARVAIEAGTSFGWREFVGDEGDTVCINRYGASAPAAVVLEKFGFTADNVVARATALLK